MGVINVLIVDDHPIARHGIAAALGLHPDICIVGEAVEGGEAIEMVSTLLTRPDVVLMDVQMPNGMGGVDATRRIKRKWPEIRVIALTTYSEPEVVHDMLEAGADGYLLKSAQPEEITEVVTNADAFQFSSQAAQALARYTRTPSPQLTPQTRITLELLCEGLTNRQIADRLHVSESSVKRYVGSIFMELGVDNRVSAVNAARALGLVSDI